MCQININKTDKMLCEIIVRRKLDHQTKWTVLLAVEAGDNRTHKVMIRRLICLHDQLVFAKVQPFYLT